MGNRSPVYSVAQLGSLSTLPWFYASIAHNLTSQLTDLTMNLSLKITRPGSLAARKRQSANVSTNAVKEVFMPALSSTMTEGKIVSWLKGPGDKVTKGEALVVVESGTLFDDCHFLDVPLARFPAVDGVCAVWYMYIESNVSRCDVSRVDFLPCLTFPSTVVSR
jgi:hypothetical protein